MPTAPEPKPEPQPVHRFKVDSLDVAIYAEGPQLAVAAAITINEHLSKAIEKNGSAAVILATGNSQIKFLRELIALRGVDWSKVTLFHMDEYLGIRADHPASFRRYLRERVESMTRPRFFHYIEGDAPQPLDECLRYTALLQAQPIDLCVLGVGENGHLAFNDPPVARFDDPYRVKLVQLDDGCKGQQVREGHFPSLEAVPPYAYTLTIPALLSARKVVCLCPETRKAVAVQRALEGAIDSSCPASALRNCPQATLLLDLESSSLLKN